MAGDWIKMNKSLPRDPRVVRISSALKADRLRTVGGLLSAWCLADELTIDGRLDGYTPELMDELVGMAGLSRAMETVGWMTIGDGFLEIPRFEEHNGKSAKRRAQDSLRKTSARKADKCPQSKRTNCGPEKRREEKSNITPIVPLEDSQKAKTRRPTLREAISAGQTIGVTPDAVTVWWNKRESNEWMKGTAGGGTTPVGTNWQADLTASKGWAEEEAKKNPAAAKKIRFVD